MFITKSETVTTVGLDTGTDKGTEQLTQVTAIWLHLPEDIDAHIWRPNLRILPACFTERVRRDHSPSTWITEALKALLPKVRLKPGAPAHPCALLGSPENDLAAPRADEDKQAVAPRSDPRSAH
ncbi:hypothetical protein SKAU_G00049480 [Synaphobranchus kaupii]|uniref:Uncharacterized protein n=1 Tax=Synaphobranchus kaupii TaxID=118154 RepID=A0A9Q1G3J7_SYNKA|nr:hypothetical protein SKAU_G00049480 [Synaphobranchus kaupii]